jgi:CspA family cold shock protein
MAREKGVVKWFSTEKGYGFVRRENGEEVFVHHSDIDVEGYASLRNGESVEFEIFESDRGPKARKLVSLERAASAGGERRTERRGAESGRSRARSRSDEQAAEQVTAPKPLAEQLRERLGGRFPGFGG